MKENSYKKHFYGLITAVAILSSCHLITANILDGTGTDSCWLNEATCLVHATLHKSTMNGELEINRDTLPMDIDCATSMMKEKDTIGIGVTQPPDYLLKRFERAFAVTLNGCQKGLKWATFGFEFLPNCDKITKTIVERFHADSMYALQCTKATFIQLESLHFEHNEISTISTDALSNLSLLRELYFVSNALRHIEENSFDNLHFIERIHMKDETLLFIKDKYLFKHTNVAELSLVNLKGVTSLIFENLPETLMNLTICKTSIARDDIKDIVASSNDDDVGVLHVNNPRLLRNVTIKDCQLKVFQLKDVHGSVLYLNLSGNRLKDMEILTNDTNTTSELIILDISNNQLSNLPMLLLQPYKLQRLQQLNLRGNLLKQLPFVTLLDSLPALQYTDLSFNQLEYLSVMNAQLENAVSHQMRIRIDGNPWSCKWLLNYAHSHPDTFRIFQYEKFLSQINVNGLACTPAVAETYETTSPVTIVSKPSRNFSINSNEMYLNISTFTLIYGSPWDVKRNQRAEALIIVFMLPIGIAILFLLLYLWIYCQKVFHLSFYQKFPLLNRNRQRHQARAPTNRFDIVRQMPPSSNSVLTTMNNNEGYELPLNNCNCVQNEIYSGNNTPHMTNEKCRKIHHITYVPLMPTERAQQIYEEIIDNEGDECKDVVTDQKRSIHPIYDHLTFK